MKDINISGIQLSPNPAYSGENYIVTASVSLDSLTWSDISDRSWTDISTKGWD